MNKEKDIKDLKVKQLCENYDDVIKSREFWILNKVFIKKLKEFVNDKDKWKDIDIDINEIEIKILENFLTNLNEETYEERQDVEIINNLLKRNIVKKVIKQILDSFQRKIRNRKEDYLELEWENWKTNVDKIIRWQNFILNLSYWWLKRNIIKVGKAVNKTLEQKTN
jgi:hypothetical protein